MWVDFLCLTCYSKYILPGGKPVEEGFEYNSGNNVDWLSEEELREALKKI